MPDRIFATYTPTTMPGNFHTAIHYERTDPTKKVTKRLVIEALPEKEDLSAQDKATSVIEEALRNNDGPSRFGRINAKIRWPQPEDDPNAPYENLLEGDDLSSNLARMQLYAHGFNRAGFAYRGVHQNSNTFASALLRAGGVPPATGVAHDPVGSPGELLEFFTPGLNEPLQSPIGRDSSYQRVIPVNGPDSFGDRFENWKSTTVNDSNGAGSPLQRALEKYGKSAAPDGPVSATAPPLAPSSSNNSPTPIFDPSNPPPIFAPSNYYATPPNDSIQKWIASLAGVDPDNPVEFSPPPIFSPTYRR